MDRDIQSDSRFHEINTREPRHTSEIPSRDRPEQPRQQRSALPAPRPMSDYKLSESERRTLADIGHFRTVSTKDLKQYSYDQNDERMRKDLRHLVSQKLLQTCFIWLPKQDELQVLALTKRGKEVLEHSAERGALYSGFVKPAEMAHDAKIYRMYQAEAARITQQGGKLRHIVLDFELKRAIYSELSKVRPGSNEYKKLQAEVAARHGLKVVRGHIQLPDLRIEYQTRDGEVQTTDLELATLHYRPGQLASKSDAGFRFYASLKDRDRLNSVFDDHHIVAEILWL
jgi:hypothetical protein